MSDEQGQEFFYNKRSGKQAAHGHSLMSCRGDGGGACCLWDWLGGAGETSWDQPEGFVTLEQLVIQKTKDVKTLVQWWVGG